MRRSPRLAKCQDKSGLWHTLLDDPHSYLEASATAGFATVFLKRCANAMSNGTMRRVAEKLFGG
ncbi:Rhamnogalacturonides degradation protein RhiN [Salmonella enterica subsp. enterica]|uniref:Rhamnogalacturonides degradation protein RhiN n=1 Tax=Salmonella enterica I TaxID=59201 RepID=A0A379WT44_SALET|nr:Rhamnogalacturonides degradation protein RhiN [Salmonella enterica subsp. enterica]